MSQSGASFSTSPVTNGLAVTAATSLELNTAGLIDATGEKLAYSGAVWFSERTGSKSIRRVGFRFGTITKAGGSGLTVSLQDVSTSAGPPMRPDEVQDQTVAIANGDAGFASNVWYRTGVLSADRTVNFGEMLSVVFEFDGSGRLGADAVRIASLTAQTSAPFSLAGVASALRSSGGTWSSLAHTPNIILEFSDGTFGTLLGSFPFSVLGNNTFIQVNSTPDEYALRFTVPIDTVCDGASFLYFCSTNGGEFNLYDSGGTALRTVALDRPSNEFRWAYVTFAPITLTGGATYYFAIRPTTTTFINFSTFSVSAAGHLTAHVGGPDWYLATRTNAGAWTTTTTSRLCMWPALVFEGGDAEPGHGRDCAQTEAGYSMFRNGVATTISGSIGVTWIEITTRSGYLYVWSDKPLPDPQSYYHGWKAPRVKRWGRIRRAVSLRGEAAETSDFTFTLDDSDGVITQLDADRELVNATVVARSITDEGRRLEDVPRTIYRGILRDAVPAQNLLYDIRVQDIFAAVFSGTTDQQLVPSAVFGTEDFPNCNVDTVSSSAEGYETNEALGPGGSNILIASGEGRFSPGDKVTFAGHATIYSVTSSSDTDPETLLSVSPDFTAAIGSGEAITQIPAHKVEPAIGKAMPWYYGHITDRADETGGAVDPGETDVGDGQGVMDYVGDKVLPDGFTYGEFHWASHACYVVGGCPFDMLYFWNESIDQHGTDLATEAGSGGRIAIPGYDNWTDNGFTTPYVDKPSGRRCTVLYLRGIWRDWALGIRPAPPNRGGRAFAVGAYGAETVGDSSGLLIVRAFEQRLHIYQNWVTPFGEAYVGGLWGTTPSFPDDPDLLAFDENSFFLADDQSEIYVAGGFRGDFGVGVNNERITRRQLEGRLNDSFGTESFTNHQCQYAITLVNVDLASVVLQPTLTWIRDIFSGTWEIEPLTRELHPVMPFNHTEDYVGRMTSGWRSALTGVTELTNDDALADYGPGPPSAPLDLYMIRGKNRATDPDEYQQGTDTAVVVLALALARTSVIQKKPKFLTGPAGFVYELADVVPVTAYQAGYVERPLRVERIEIDPGVFTTDLELYDMDPMWDAVDSGSP